MPAKQDALECVAEPPSADTRALIGLVIPFPYDRLTGPWHPSSDWPTGHYIVAIAHAQGQTGDQVAFVAETEEWTPHGHVRRTLSALGIGNLCWDTITDSCAVDGVDDPSVFARLKGSIVCADHPISPVRAWKVQADGTIVEIPADHVTCGHQTCD